MKVYAIGAGIDIDWSCCFCCLGIAPSAQLPNKSVWLLQLTGDNPQSTIPEIEITCAVGLLTQVLCKPTHFVFSIIHNHHAQHWSNTFQQCSERLAQ